MPILLIVFCICPCGRKCIGLDRPPRQNPDVPAADIDGWDGVVRPFLPHTAEIPMSAGFTSMSANMQAVLDAIVRPDTGGSGYRLAAFYFPVQQSGKRRGMPLDGRQNGFMGAIANGTMLFQQVDDPMGAPLETQVVGATITYTAGFNSVEGSGYTALYAALQQVGAAGFSLSAVIDEPNLRMKGIFSAETSVHVVCQRPAGVAASPKTYAAVAVPIHMQAGFSKISAQIPELNATLKQFADSGHKLASVYNPPTVRAQAFSTSATTPCHLIFEQTDVPYCFVVVDAFFEATGGFGSISVNHAPYQQLIAKYVAKGWELAGMIDMPDGNTTGVTRMESTIKLIFQAKQTPSAAATAAPSSTPVATPVVTTGVVVGTVPPAGEAQNVPLVVAAKSEV